ncbi:MAG: UDP-N-acetylmuramate dehydrogenase [Leptospirales bacterium]
MERIKKKLYEANIAFEINVPLSKYSSYRTGGPAHVFVKSKNALATQKIQQLVSEIHIPVFYLGGGSNVLFQDDGFHGLVVYGDYENSIELIEVNGSSLVEVNSNHSSASFSRKVGKMGYAGFEFLSTIPGKLAGAVAQNAGCYGSEIKDVLESAFISSETKIGWVPSGELEFSYRFSLFKTEPSLFIHALRFFAIPGDIETITLKMEEFRTHRLNSQPKNRKSAGSVFKNPDGKKAWQLISDCGLSGYTTGGACISKEHANFIVNESNATSRDILQIIHYTQQIVLKETGVKLDTEIIIVPEN